MGKRMFWLRKIAAIVVTGAMVGTALPETVFVVSAAQKETVANAETMQETEVQEEAVNAGGNYELMSNVQGSSILHCWNWSYKTIEEHMELIAECGYSAIQTSPAQQPKDYTYEGNVCSEVGYPGLSSKGNWWKMYQPVTFSVCDNGQTWLGTKAELESMCATAEKYGIKVLVDIVANHLGNITGWQNSMSDISPQVGEYWNPDMLTDSTYWHINDLQIWMSDGREHFTQGTMGMPDLKTQDPRIQKYVYEYLDELIDCGVDGFRFDAAKHIETPDDDPAYAGNFWPTVLNEARSHYKSKTGGDLYVYGEILNTVGDNFSIDSYTKYMSVTDNSAGNHLLEAFRNNNASGGVGMNYAADKSVLWAESHDTYMNESSRYASDKSIVRTWALVANKKDAATLFFARPYYSQDTLIDGRDGSDRNNLENVLEPAMMGECETYIWASKEVAAINHFNNRMKDSADNMGTSGNVVYCQRGDGVVLASFDGAGNVSVGVSGLSNGSYTDEVSGGTFTVSGGQVSGNITSEYGIAVLYKNTMPNPGEAKPVKISSSIADKSNFYLDTLSLTLSADNADSASYETSTGESGSITGDTKVEIGQGASVGEAVTVTVTASSKRGTYKKTFTYYKQDLDIDQCIFFKVNSGYLWTKANAYVYAEKSAGVVTETLSGWSGVPMFEYAVEDDGSVIYAVEVPEIDKYNKVNFNNNVAEIKTSLGSYGQLYDAGKGCWSQYLEPGSGKAKVDASVDSGVIRNEKQVTFTVTNADTVVYSINGGEAQSFTGSVTLTVGRNLSEGEIETITITAIKGDKVTEKSYIYTMGENKPDLRISQQTGTTFDNFLDVTLQADNVVEANYQIDDEPKQSLNGTETIKLGVNSNAGDMVTVTVYGKSSNGKEARITASYVKSGKGAANGIYFKNTSNWDKVNAYLWNDTTEDSKAPWPGVSMEPYDAEENIYVVELSENEEYNYIIFNNGSSQTEDLALGSLGQIYEYDSNQWSDYMVGTKPTITATMESGEIDQATEITYTVKDAETSTIKAGFDTETPFADSVTMKVGEGLKKGESETVIIKAINGDCVNVMVYTYEMTKEAEEPDNTPTPMISEEPEHSPTPVISDIPDGTPTPVVSTEPSNSPTPLVSEEPIEPTETPTPVVSREPSKTPIPSISDTPIKPSDTPIPDISDTPIKPSDTPIPDISQQPEHPSNTPAGEISDIPEKPTDTPTPNISDLPIIPTATLTPTPKPVNTQKPQTTVTPSSTPVPTNPSKVDEKDIANKRISMKTSLNYNGELQFPKVSIVGLHNGVDYQVYYLSSSKNVGTYQVEIVGIGDYHGSVIKTYRIEIYKNKTYTIGNYKYKVTNVTAGNRQVTITGSTKKTLKTISIGSNVKIGGVSFKITAVGSKAFANFKKLKSVTIGSNVKKIESKAFYGDSALKKITIKSKNLTSVGSKAVKNINKKAVIQVPSGKVSKYKKLFKSSTGYRNTMTIKK